VSQYQKKPSPTHTHEEEEGFEQTTRSITCKPIPLCFPEPARAVRLNKASIQPKSAGWLAQINSQGRVLNNKIIKFSTTKSLAVVG